MTRPFAYPAYIVELTIHEESTGFPDVASADLQHPAIWQMCVVNVIMTALLDILHRTFLYVDNSTAMSTTVGVVG